MHFCVYLSLPPLNIKQEYFSNNTLFARYGQALVIIFIYEQ